jgi:hypothetical protein
MVSPFKRDPLESDERGQRYWDFVITIAGVVCTEDLNPHVMVLAGGPPIFDSYVLSLHKPGVAQALVKGSRRVSPKSNKIMQHRERTKF